MILAAKNYFSESGTEVRNHIAIMKTTEVLTAPFQVPGRICRIEDISRTALKELEFLKIFDSTRPKCAWSSLLPQSLIST